jgi:hypothetical protein
MKTLAFIVSMVLTGVVLFAPEQGPSPKISQQITNYFNYYFFHSHKFLFID